MRCAARTFNLVASLALSTNLLKKTGPDIASFKALDKKALAMFNAQEGVVRLVIIE